MTRIRGGTTSRRFAAKAAIATLFMILGWIPVPRRSAQFTHCRSAYCQRVRQIEECREIIKYLLRGESVLLNLENIDPKDCGRVVDLLSGAAFALQGRMLKVAHLSYLLAPENVEVIEEDVYTASRMRYR